MGNAKKLKNYLITTDNQSYFVNDHVINKKYIKLHDFIISNDFYFYFNTYNSLMKLDVKYSLFINLNNFLTNSFFFVKLSNYNDSRINFFFNFIHTYKNNLNSNSQILFQNKQHLKSYKYYNPDKLNLNLLVDTLRKGDLYSNIRLINHSFYGIQQDSLFFNICYLELIKINQNQKQLIINNYNIILDKFVSGKINLIQNKRNFHIIKLYDFKKCDIMSKSFKQNSFFYVDNISYNINMLSCIKKYNITEYGQYKLKRSKYYKINSEFTNYNKFYNYKINFEDLLLVLYKWNTHPDLLINKSFNAEWYGRFWANYKLYFLHFNVHNRKNFKAYWISKTKIAIPDIPKYATPISNIIDLQTIDSYFGNFFEKPAICQPILNGLIKNTSNTKWIEIDPEVWQNKNFMKYFSNINLNYNFYTLFFNCIFHPTCLGFIKFKCMRKNY